MTESTIPQAPDAAAQPMPPAALLRRVVPLLFASGACSLVYETVWLRELRLVFGASTAASAVVVACFVGGLGAGGLFFGRRTDREPRPLALYSRLETGVAVSAAITPLLLMAVRAIYLALGGTRVLGMIGGSAVRLVLAAIVFAVPTVLMGGTLPAIARVVATDEDRGRRRVALLYGVNTLGAVTGCAVSTFVLFETFGTRLTLGIACLVNALVAVSARSLARSVPDVEVTAAHSTADVDAPPDSEDALPSASFALAAAAVAGFVLCLMELVWYRMLAPLLGGSVFTFGVILAVVLLGMALGGVAYGALPPRARATRRGFAWTCLLEAAFLALPYALGDRIAVLAAALVPVGALGFGPRVASWTAIAAIVVLPAAALSGVQFSALIGLVGRGSRGVARDVGRVYAANTVGAIVGSLAGGFGLLPALTAPGSWRLAVWLLLAMGGLALVPDTRKHPARIILPAMAFAATLLLLHADGPTAAWRHSPIGAGRVSTSTLRSDNDIRNWERDRRRAIVWEADGVESSVGLDRSDGLAFIVNGKNDGSARADAGTSVMAGLLGALLQPHATRAMVIGLGTGETAGWLAAVDSITDVDVAELEPAILEVARRCGPVNHRALDNPKVHVTIGDARELLLTSKGRYSVIMSEPSNPYRAGVASLFTKSFYEAIRDRLDQEGVFVQWVQAYEVDAITMRTVFATLGAVFPEVETWELDNGDLALVATLHPVDHDLAKLAARMREEPFKSALAKTWRATDLSGLLAHFVATAELTRRIAEVDRDRINTDDQNLIELGFARTTGTGLSRFSVEDVRRAGIAGLRGGAETAGGSALALATVCWADVDEARYAFYVAEEAAPTEPPSTGPERAHRIAALHAFGAGQSHLVVSEWGAQPAQPRGPTELAIVAWALADTGQSAATTYAERLSTFDAGEALAVVAHLAVRTDKLEEATVALEGLFKLLRDDPWPMHRLVKLAIDDAMMVAAHDGQTALRLYSALREPFAVRVLDDYREQAAFSISLLSPGPSCVEAAARLEPYTPWNEAFLRARAECFVAQKAPGREASIREWQEFQASRPSDFAEGLTR